MYRQYTTANAVLANAQPVKADAIDVPNVKHSHSAPAMATATVSGCPLPLSHLTLSLLRYGMSAANVIFVTG